MSLILSKAKLFHSAKWTNLSTRMMPQIVPIHLESTVVPFMQQLMRQRVLHMSFAHQVVLTDQDAVLRMVAACLLGIARRASDAGLNAIGRK